MPFEQNCGPKHDRDCIDVYIERSPVFHAENLKVPMLVHVATNDCDVYLPRRPADGLHADARSSRIWRRRRSTRIRREGRAGCGHTFSRRVNPETLERDDSPGADRLVESDVGVL